MQVQAAHIERLFLLSCSFYIIHTMYMRAALLPDTPAPYVPWGLLIIRVVFAVQLI